MDNNNSIPLKLFNSLGRQLEQFEPLQPGQVSLYSCGPTVYSYAHIGNLRAYIFVDTLKRVLEWKGYNVKHIMNITDVGHLTSDADEGEDKMEKAAQQQHQSVWDIAEFYTKHFKEDISALNIIPPTQWCKATDNIQEMISFALKCEENGYTYLLEDGLYLDTSKVPDYGKLGLLNIAGQEEGVRVAPREGKKHSTDFVLWRRSPKDKQRLMEWDSPWGVGAPGWHLECSVMSIDHLGTSFDIHTGGIDHRQLHHCNEIAQNQAYTNNDSPAAKFWVHNEFLITRNQKMAKSTGDFLRLKTITDEGIHPLVYRYFCLMANYRTPLEFSMEALLGARNGFSRLLKHIESLKQLAGDLSFLSRAPEMSVLEYRKHLEQGLPDNLKGSIKDFDSAICDDLNTPQALAMAFAHLEEDPTNALRVYKIFDLVLGLKLLELQPDELNLRPAQAAIDEVEIQKLIEQRNAARAGKDFKTADEIRKQLQEQGVALMDSDQGTTWEWAKPS